jgi:NtrC-family two-component system response regulator AlgB
VAGDLAAGRLYEQPGGTARKYAEILQGCDGGTLLLDGIADLSVASQHVLLHLLRQRAGGTAGRANGGGAAGEFDVRVIATVGPDAEQRRTDKRFQIDLLEQLEPVEIRLPPLRRRPEDVVPLAEHMLLHFSRTLQRPPTGYSLEALQALKAYPWPGNLRELRNVAERAAILCERRSVGPEHLRLSPDAAPAEPRIGSPLPIKKIEELHIRGVLARCRSLEEAAGVLGINSVTLWRRRKRYHI